MNYKTSSELENKVLKNHDIVLIGKRHYVVRSNFLEYINGCQNGIIFDDLNLSRKGFCTIHYGYNANPGAWPKSKKGDYAALTRVVLALMKLTDQ